MLVYLYKPRKNYTCILFYDEDSKEFLLRFNIFSDIDQYNHSYIKEITCETREKSIVFYSDYYKDFVKELELNSDNLIDYIRRRKENSKYKKHKLKISKAEFEKFLKEYILLETMLNVDDMYFINKILQKQDD